MKRLCCLLLLGVLLLGGCAASAPEAVPTPLIEPISTPETTDDPAEALRFPRTARGDALAMTNLLTANRFLPVGNTLYGLDVRDDGTPQLVAWQLTDGELSDCTVLAESVVPEWLTLADDALYWCNAAAGGRLERMQLTEESPEVETVLDDSCSALQVVDDTLYLCDSAHRFCRLTAEGNTDVLVDTEVWYPCLHDGVLLYQNAADGETLHLRELASGTDRRLNDVPSYAPLCLDQVIWYSQGSGDGCAMASLDLRTGRGARYGSLIFRGEAQFVRDGGKWGVRLFKNEPAAIQLSGSLAGPWQEDESDLYRMCDYQDEALRVDALYQRDGRLFCFALVDGEGQEQRFVSGTLLETP